MQQSVVSSGANLNEKKRSTLPFEVVAQTLAFTVPLLLYRSLGAGTLAAFGSGWEQMAIARSLAAGHGFSNPFGYVTGPTAVCAPVHPGMLAVILHFWGDRPMAVIPSLLAEVAIQSIGVVVLLRIAVAAFSSWIPGALAAFAILLTTRPFPQWETSSAWLAFEVLFLCAQLGIRSRSTGAIMGLGWLVSPALAPASFAIVWLLRGRKYVTTSAAVAVVVILPWSVRNWAVLRAPIFLRDNFGLELFLSNNDLAGPTQEDAEAERYGLWHPGNNADVAADVARAGEPKYFGHLQSEAVDWIRNHPGRFLRLTAARVWLWWASSWPVAGISLLSFVGLWLNRRSTVGRAATAGLLLFPVPYYVIQFNPRYTYPILWIAALMAGDACFQLVQRFTQEKASNASSEPGLSHLARFGSKMLSLIRLLKILIAVGTILGFLRSPNGPAAVTAVLGSCSYGGIL